MCSNHFKYGQPFPVDLHPTLFLRGYDVNVIPRRSPGKLKAISPSTPQPNKKTNTSRFRSFGVQVNPGDIEFVTLEHDHSYTRAPFKRRVFSSEYVDHLEDELDKLSSQCDDLRTKLNDAKAKVMQQHMGTLC